MAEILLGLIGENISHSRAPHFHRLAGRLTGHIVTYNRLEPRAMGQDLSSVLGACARDGYRGVNITHPYKEVAANLVTVEDEHVRAIGAVNTVIFSHDGSRGFNTDYSGFISAFRAARPTESAGVVCLIGAGGAGRAVGFGLLELGAEEVRVVDRNVAKAQELARLLRSRWPEARVTAMESAALAAEEATGIVNCTPLGMVGYGGTPLEHQYMIGAKWAFDAVYTPLETVFLRDAAGAGLQVISGYELFFGQGIDAWDIFVGAPFDPAQLRQALAAATAEEIVA